MYLSYMMGLFHDSMIMTAIDQCSIYEQSTSNHSQHWLKNSNVTVSLRCTLWCDVHAHIILKAV